MDWYKHDIGAYRRHTTQLSMLEDSAYRRLLDQYYLLGGPLPDDLNWAYRAAGAVNQYERAAVRKILATYFPQNGDGFRHNTRADQELEQYQQRCSTNRAIARQRNANESSTNRSPIQTNIETNKGKTVDNFKGNGQDHDTCKHVLETGNPCGKPGVHKHHPGSKDWYCREH